MLLKNDSRSLVRAYSYTASLVCQFSRCFRSGYCYVLCSDHSRCFVYDLGRRWNILVHNSIGLFVTLPYLSLGIGVKKLMLCFFLYKLLLYLRLLYLRLLYLSMLYLAVLAIIGIIMCAMFFELLICG